MQKYSLVIEAPNGLHVRPLAQIVAEAKKFESTITIHSGDKNASAKSLFKLQTLNLSKGTTIHIEADGTDETAAISALTQLIPDLE